MHMKSTCATVLFGLSAALMGACAVGGENEELGLGDVEGNVATGDDGLEPNYGQALTCKDIPVVPTLKRPSIVISLDGLTLHLKDLAGTYDQVFPIGPGKYEEAESLTITGNFMADLRGKDTVDGQYGPYYSCRVWWTDTDASTPDVPVRSPVFAGLPFIRFRGAYAIHGPIDNYTSSTGGNLRRGYVSHGCVRMSADGIKELYGRVLGRKVPVKVQKDVERDAAGKVVDVPTAMPWVGSECATDANCTYAGGICERQEGALRGTCSMACTNSCPDRAGETHTFCQARANGGHCVPKSDLVKNGECASYAGRLNFGNVSRPNGRVSADVCALP